MTRFMSRYGPLGVVLILVGAAAGTAGWLVSGEPYLKCLLGGEAAAWILAGIVGFGFWALDRAFL